MQDIQPGWGDTSIMTRAKYKDLWESVATFSMFFFSAVWGPRPNTHILACYHFSIMKYHDPEIVQRLVTSHFIFLSLIEVFH